MNQKTMGVIPSPERSGGTRSQVFALRCCRLESLEMFRLAKHDV